MKFNLQSLMLMNMIESSLGLFCMLIDTTGQCVLKCYLTVVRRLSNLVFSDIRIEI